MEMPETNKKEILKEKLEDFWHNTGYVIETETVDRIREYLKDAERFIEDDQITDGFDAYYRAKREYRLARRKGALYFYRNWAGMRFSILSIAFFVVGLLIVWNFRDNIPIVLLPTLSVLGGGIGGASAVLIRAIDVDPDSEVVSHWSWYVIKTTLGAALGLITYFALMAGLNLFSDNVELTKPEGAVVIGFLAGFFETFSTGILARLAGQFSGDEVEEDEDSKDSK